MLIWFGLIHYSAFFSSEGHVALDRNPGTGYDTLLLRMIPGDLLSAFPHRQFNTLPGLLDSLAALPNSYPSALRAMQGGSLYHFYDGLWYDPAERRTHDLPCEWRTRYRLSQPSMVLTCWCWHNGPELTFSDQICVFKITKNLFSRQYHNHRTFIEKSRDSSSTMDC